MTATDEFWRDILNTVHELDNRSYYQLLGVAQDATAETIGEAYYRLIRRIHPDRYAMEEDSERRRALVRLYARVGEAYRVLTAPRRRSVYDQNLAAGEMRLRRGAAAKKPAPVDPRTPQAKNLYQRGKALLEQGDRRGARAQWQLAIQFEPDSRLIAAALRELDRNVNPGQAADTPPSPGLDHEPVVPTDNATHRETPLAKPSRPALSDTLGSSRRPINIRCSTWEQVAALYKHKICGAGLFVPAKKPREPGSALVVLAHLPDERVLELAGTVAEVRGDPKPGMRLSFSALPGDISAAFRQAVALTESDHDQGEAIGHRALRSGRYAEARDELALALERSPEALGLRATYYLALAKLARQENRIRDAEIHHQTAMYFDPHCDTGFD